MRDSNRRFAWLLLILIPAALFGSSFQPQEPTTSALHITTQERLQTEPWWPTMDTAPLKAYAGSDSCVSCHADQVSATATGMQLAARRGSEPHLPGRQPSGSFVSGAFTYSLTADGAAVRLSVATSGERAMQTAYWDIGAGDMAHTYLYEAEGRWYQSEASYYTRPSVLGITTGFGPSTATTAHNAIGNLLSPAEARTCFGCHTVHATTSAGLDPSHAEGGVGCEGCHGPGQPHVSRMDAKGAPGNATKLADYKVFNPAKLSPADSIDFCGACHRSFADASLSTGPEADRAVVRFQPYRLEESKCWRATQDARLTCVACHDPHQPLNRDSASYDKNCLQCHAGIQHQAAVDLKPDQHCVSCHMPKVNVPSMHGDFSDHFIRIARAGDPLPR